MTTSLEPTKLILSRWENMLQHYEKMKPERQIQICRKSLIWRLGNTSAEVCQSAATGNKVLHESKNSLWSAPWLDVYDNTLEICLMPETIIPWKLFLMSGLVFFLMFGPIWGGKNSSPGLTANIESNLMACNFPNMYKNCSSCELTCCFPRYIFTLGCSCETSLDTMPGPATGKVGDGASPLSVAALHTTAS